MSPSSYHALLFNLRLNAGTYKTEKVNCFCGSDNYKQITDKDRYGISYKLCLCLDCGLLYVNPRMTDESLKMFYKNDYREIYSDRVEIAADQAAVQGNDRIKNLISEIVTSHELPAPKVIFEIGCAEGTNLLPFSDCERIGVDYDYHSIQKGREAGLNLQIGGIDILEKYGKKADLIIMNHVLEHMTDLETDIKRIRELLSDKGMLFIGVPGLYAWDKASLYQNAHNYQFNGNTLLYVMKCCGFDELYLTEEINSVWGKADFMDKANKNPEEYKYVDSYLTGDKFLMPPIRVNCKFAPSEIRENIKKTANRGLPQITELINKHPDSESIIIGGGPSVNGYASKIRKMQKAGAKVYAIERMYQWCLNNKIVPDYVIALDASADVVDGFKVIHDDTTHILVAQCRPEVFDMLEGKKVYYFLLNSRGLNYKEIFKDIDIEKLTFVNSGSSVTLCAMSIAMTLGARKHHVFGFDCHIGNGNYAKGIVGVGDIKETIEIEIGEKTFRTTTAYFSFMQQFFDILYIGKQIGFIEDMRVYGDSMCKAASLVDIDGDKKGKA